MGGTGEASAVAVATPPLTSQTASRDLMASKAFDVLRLDEWIIFKLILLDPFHDVERS
jgi:hypothetical protein